MRLGPLSHLGLRAFEYTESLLNSKNESSPQFSQLVRKNQLLRAVVSRQTTTPTKNNARTGPKIRINLLTACGGSLFVLVHPLLPDSSVENSVVGGRLASWDGVF